MILLYPYAIIKPYGGVIFVLHQDLLYTQVEYLMLYMKQKYWIGKWKIQLFLEYRMLELGKILKDSWASLHILYVL